MIKYFIIGFFIIVPLSTNANELERMLKEDGFCALTWEQNLATITGMKCVETKGVSEDLKEYVRPEDILELKGIKLKIIRYIFWRNSLYAVTIMTEGHANYLALKRVVLESIGSSYHKDDSNERYVWSNRKTDWELKYIDQGEQGRLQMKSTNINRQIELTKYIKSRNYSNWIRPRRVKK
jgi:hypothetical protein